MLTKFSGSAAQWHSLGAVVLATVLVATICLPSASAQIDRRAQFSATVTPSLAESCGDTGLSGTTASPTTFSSLRGHTGSAQKEAGSFGGANPSLNEQCDPPPPPPPPSGGAGFTKVIQLGDSYSSGVGSLPEDPAFEFGIQTCANPHYFRDEITPGIRIADDLDLDAAFGACSGTLVDTEALGMNFADQIQLVVDEGHAANGGADTLIVYSIAGNDLEVNGNDWTSIVAQCFLPGPACNPAPAAADWTNLEGLANQAHNAVKAAFPQATVRVMGYPMLFNQAATGSCNVGSITVGGVDFGLDISNEEAILLDAVNRQLNTKLRSAVSTIAATGYDIEYVEPPAGAVRPGVCQWQTDTSHVLPHVLNGSSLSQNSFHPSEAGYQGLYEDLARNLGLTPKPLAGTGPAIACSGGSSSNHIDPWGTRIGAGLRVRAVNSLDVLNNSLLLDNVTTLDVAVDMLGAPVGTADIEVYAEGPGATPTTVTLTPSCYRASDGSDRGVFTGTALLRTSQPFTSIVARLRNSNDDLIASAHSGVASVEALETRNTVESVGVRINNSLLAKAAALVEFELERLMEDQLRGMEVHHGEIWVADVSGLTVQFNSLEPQANMPHGGLRASIDINGIDVVVRAPLGNDAGCNWRISKTNTVGALVDLAFDPAMATGAPLTIADIEVDFPSLYVDVHNAATQEVQLCHARSANFLVDLAAGPQSLQLHTALLIAEATEPRWLMPLNDVLGELFETQMQEALAQQQSTLPPPLNAVDITAPVSIGTLGGDAAGIFASASLTLPGGPVPDDRNGQSIGASLTQSSAPGDTFDVSLFMELATINRKLALAGGLLSGAPAQNVLVDLNDDGQDELLQVRTTAAPYLTRGPDGSACASMCVEVQIPPVQVTLFQPAGAGWTWDRDVLLTFADPVRLSSFSQNSDGSLAFGYDTSVSIAASVLASNDGSATISGVPEASWANAITPLFSDQLQSVLPASTPALELPPELGAVQVTLSSGLRDVAGNEDLQILLDVGLTAPTITIPLCNGLTPTIVGTPFDDVIFGTSGDDVIHALGGNDLVEAGGGNDTVCGGEGQSILDGEQGDDWLGSQGWDDFIRGGSGDDDSWAGGGDDYMVGDSGKDWLDGAGGDDTILGQDGSDRGLIGGAGKDTIEGGSGNDYIEGGDGHDTIRGGSNFELFSVDRDTIHGGKGNDWIDGGDRDDLIYGDAGIDTIDGGTGDDTIHGGDDRDIIRGGPDWVGPTATDNDTIYGDGGDDVIRGGANADSLWGGLGNDDIYGGNKGDDIHGGDGDDYLYGEDGADNIWGDGGYDRAWGGANIFDDCWAEWENSC